MCNWVVGLHKRLARIGKMGYVSLVSRKTCFWRTWVLTDEIQAVKWRILVLSTGQGPWRTQAQVLDSTLRPVETFVCAHQRFLKVFFEFKSVWSYLWKCHVCFISWGAVMQPALSCVKSGSSWSCVQLWAYPHKQWCWVEVQSQLGSRNPSDSALL